MNMYLGPDYAYMCMHGLCTDVVSITKSIRVLLYIPGVKNTTPAPDGKILDKDIILM